MYACKSAEEHIVSLLLQRGADPNLHDKWGATCLMIATEKDHVQVVQLLLLYNASVAEINAVGTPPRR